ncbi:esterase lipase [Fusarium mundagurra]|uniref:Esterase lipase n=1 Tax=Fusarium mundagurra TaxID=1567541 RepID=A0A8H6DF69_9HYPO|nr:esterase lipase [Fusarium mundagurra]
MGEAVQVFQLQHPLLGCVNGTDGDVMAFRGIQYATLENRLAQAVMKDTYPKVIDATKYGPISPNPPGSFQLEMKLMQQTLPNPDYLVSSDTEALNLNIWVPKGQDGQLLQNLPVYVFIHGGGFISGSGNSPHYDLTRLVRLSAEMETPIIGVTVKLGLLGLFTSQELRNAGFKANNQLRDQRTAFQWLKKHIEGFGGDPENITASGESTGGVCTGLHLLSQEPLFNRAYLTGGSPLLMQVAGPEEHENHYKQVIEALGLATATPDERIFALLGTPYDELLTRVPMNIAYRPMLDGDVVPFAMNHANVQDKESKIPGRQWLNGLGSSLAILAAFKKSNIAKKFPQTMRARLGDNAATERLLAAYDADPSKDDETVFAGFLRFSTDIGYYAATCSFAQGWAPITHTFAFNEPNPWPGMFQGHATHVFDIAMLFQNFQTDLPAAQVEAGRQMAADLFLFVHGRPPWVTADKGTMVYGPSVDGPVRNVVSDGLPEEAGRRRAIIDASDAITIDEIAATHAAFMASA